MKRLLALTAIAAVISSTASQGVLAPTSVTRTRSVASPTDSSSSSSTSTSASSTAIATHKVRVGLDHKYDPNTIEADVGDIIEFTFYPTNHSVVKAEFGQPCIPYNMVHPGTDIFFSGPIEQLNGNEEPLPIWTLEVNSTEPVFFYCSAPGSCINSYMVGVINPNRTHNVDVQTEFVTNGTTKFQLSPGEPFPAEGETPGNDDPGSGSGSTPEDGDSGSGGGGGGLAPGAIAGIAVGGAAVLLIAIALVYFCGRKGGIEKGYRRSARVSRAPPPMVEAHYVDDSHGGAGAGSHHHYSPYDSTPKSPPPPSTYTNSIYGGPPTSGGMYPPDPYNRTRSPNQLSEIGGHSPHASYVGVGGHPSPGHPPYAFGSPHMNRESLAPPPAELEAHVEPPRRELG